MPKAEVGSTKHLANKMKSKGLQRLRWYCQVCEKQCRDDNGFKCHVNSESHVRNMQAIGQDPKKVIREYSMQFKNDFLRLLRTAHGEKAIHINHFYQEYIQDKEHIHMNSTQWASLTEFAKYLGREGVCRVTETEKGINIAWVDNSPEALRRTEASRKKERQDRGDEEREQRLINQQIKRANEEAADKQAEDEESRKAHELDRKEGETISILFGAKPKVIAPGSEPTTASNAPIDAVNGETILADRAITSTSPNAAEEPATQPAAPGKLAFGLGAAKHATKSKSIFSTGRKANPLAAPKSTLGPAKPLSNMERIMREEMERKRQCEGPPDRNSPDPGAGKRMKRDF